MFWERSRFQLCADSLKILSVNDQFTYYIMFKPVAAKEYDAIWVPVAKAKWSWKVTVTRWDKKTGR